jgi:hypothetical protein
VLALDFWCTDCAANTIWLGVGQLSGVHGVCRATVNNWIRLRRVHTRKSPGGVRLVCLCSVCGQHGRGSCAGCKARFLSKGVQR